MTPATCNFTTVACKHDYLIIYSSGLNDHLFVKVFLFLIVLSLGLDFTFGLVAISSLIFTQVLLITPT